MPQHLLEVQLGQEQRRVHVSFACFRLDFNAVFQRIDAILKQGKKYKISKSCNVKTYESQLQI